MASITRMRVVDPADHYEKDISAALNEINESCSNIEETQAAFFTVLRDIVSKGLGTPLIRAREYKPLSDVIDKIPFCDQPQFSDTLKRVCERSLQQFSTSTKTPPIKGAWGLKPPTNKAKTSILDSDSAWEGPKATPMKKPQQTERQLYISENREIFDRFVKLGVLGVELPYFSLEFLKTCVANKTEFDSISSRAKPGDWKGVPIYEKVRENFEANMRIYFKHPGLFNYLNNCQINTKHLVTIGTDFLSTISIRDSELRNFHAMYPSYPLFGLESLGADLLDCVLSDPRNFSPLIGVDAKKLRGLTTTVLRDLMINPDKKDNKAWIESNQISPKTGVRKPRGV